MSDPLQLDAQHYLAQQLAALEQQSQMQHNQQLPINFYTPFNEADPAIDDLFGSTYDPTTSQGNNDDMLDLNAGGMPIPGAFTWSSGAGAYTPSYAASYESASSLLSSLGDRALSPSVLSSANSSPSILDVKADDPEFSNFIREMSASPMPAAATLDAAQPQPPPPHNIFAGTNTDRRSPQPNVDDQALLRQQLQNALKLDVSYSSDTKDVQQQPNMTSQFDFRPDRDTIMHTGFTPVSETHTGFTPVSKGHTGFTPISDGHTGFTPISDGHTGFTPVTESHTGFTPVSDSHTGFTPASESHTGFTPIVSSQSQQPLTLQTNFTTTSQPFHTGLTPTSKTQMAEHLVGSSQPITPNTLKAYQNLFHKPTNAPQIDLIPSTPTGSKSGIDPRLTTVQRQQSSNLGELNPSFSFGNSSSSQMSPTTAAAAAALFDDNQQRQARLSAQPAGGALRVRPAFNRSRSKSDTSMYQHPSRSPSPQPLPLADAETNAFMQSISPAAVDIMNDESNLGDTLSPPSFNSRQGHERRKSFGSMRDASLAPPTLTRKGSSSSRRQNPANFVCPYEDCDKAFTRQYNLKSHLLTHTNTRPFRCDFPGCDLAFSRQHDRKRHFNLHLGIKPHTCEVCGRGFARLDALGRHLTAAHQRKEQGLLL